jgi:hypothetical protein
MNEGMILKNTMANCCLQECHCTILNLASSMIMMQKDDKCSLFSVASVFHHQGYKKNPIAHPVQWDFIFYTFMVMCDSALFL